MKHYANPLNLTDSYKVGHQAMYPPGMEFLQSNWTPRASRIDGVDQVVFFGLQAFLKDILVNRFQKDFFDRPADEVIGEHKARVEKLLGMPFDCQHWYDLHQLGYLPLQYFALPEGTEVPLRVPMFLVENTVPGYGWLVNYFESIMSNNIWLPMTSATIGLKFRRMLSKWAEKTSDTPEFVDFQGHDFSFRGMSATSSAAASGAAHLLSFAGSDTLIAQDWIEYYYGEHADIGFSVPATEHSVMCAGGKDDELETISRLLDLHPKGILSVVSDTWDLWHVITNILPQLKDKIMAREGTLVIRPDSGDPVDILCGRPDGFTEAEGKGVIELLHEIFPGEDNSKGYKTLDSHIGVIYGDAITHHRADQICRRLAWKGYASTIPVLGIGSFTYQMNTRDTFGFAMKATWCQVNGEGRNLYKSPVTDDGTKKSAKGKLAVILNERSQLTLVNEATPEQLAVSLLKPVWKDGKFVDDEIGFWEVAERMDVRSIVPAPIKVPVSHV